MPARCGPEQYEHVMEKVNEKSIWDDVRVGDATAERLVRESMRESYTMLWYPNMLQNVLKCLPCRYKASFAGWARRSDEGGMLSSFNAFLAWISLWAVAGEPRPDSGLLTCSRQLRAHTHLETNNGLCA